MNLRSTSWCGFLIALGVSPLVSGFCWQDLPERAPTDYERLLAAARTYASQYIAGLPSFTCSQTVEQFEADKKGTHWHKGDVLTSQLVWDQGHEQRTLQMVNSRPVSSAGLWRAPLVTEGEFGNLLDSILGDSSHVEFSWRGWEQIRNKPAAVFSYRVDRQHSPWKLALGAAEAKIAFHGLVYSDGETGTVWRITNDADQFPAELRTKSVARTVDYDEVAIGQARYVLPVRASVVLDTGKRHIRNELHFEAYRKFAVNSHISFTSAGEANPPAVEPGRR
jgi:hypothetical protein